MERAEGGSGEGKRELREGGARIGGELDNIVRDDGEGGARGRDGEREFRAENGGVRRPRGAAVKGEIKGGVIASKYNRARTITGDIIPVMNASGGQVRPRGTREFFKIRIEDGDITDGGVRRETETATARHTSRRPR